MQRPPRRRRTPAQAAEEILHAAEELFSERTYHEVTVTAIMARTTLSRKSFYVYFRDIPDVLRRLLQPIRREIDALMAAGSSDPAGLMRGTFMGMARVYARHGMMLRALYEAAGHDPQAREVWLDYFEPSVRMITAGIQSGVEAGMITRLEPEPTARALIGLNHRVFFEQLAGNPDADVDAVVALLLRIWARALHLVEPEELGWLPAG